MGAANTMVAVVSVLDRKKCCFQWKLVKIKMCFTDPSLRIHALQPEGRLWGRS